jgi:uracil-DNA glycosylase family 4
MNDRIFDKNCRLCPRLATFLDTVKDRYPDYHCRPVAPFGDLRARLLVVGLAPGMHGANRTARPFTGDYAGILLYETLHKFGFSNQPQSVSADDPLELYDCRITNAVKCLPPDNKPVGSEIATCNAYLAGELELLPTPRVVLALGGIAHRAVIRAAGLRQALYRFGHAAEHQLDGILLLDSYHCSRYNTNTGRLTTAMFEAVFARARDLILRNDK